MLSTNNKLSAKLKFNLNSQKNSDTNWKLIEKLLMQDISYSDFFNTLSNTCHILIEKTIHIQWKIYAKIET
jgi:hypothetical protein